MKQIGFRQEAAKVGGIGSCGRELCCSTWLTDFRSVNTNVARYQQLSINPQKLAGQCGKLKCCLNYELDSYLDALSNFPSSSTTLEQKKEKHSVLKSTFSKRKCGLLM
jgi:cell fate regulator YaaT (PSP1 superfamily)